jgi:hypothetical protein
MRELYEQLKARGISQDATARIKYWGKWADHQKRQEQGKIHAFNHPAVFFEFSTPIVWQSIGGGVQVADVMVRVHTLHKWLADTESGTAINLDIYDLAKEVHGWFQQYEYRGADFGFSGMDRVNWHEDEDPDQMYHHISDYMTSWTDNSTKTPRGGYEIAPPLDAAITAEFTTPDVPSLIVSRAVIAFGNVAVGQSKEETFTITGADLVDESPLIISTTNGLFLISFTTMYKTRLATMPEDGAIAETEVTIKFTPIVSGGATGSILYGVPGVNGEVTLLGAGVGLLLLEDGSNLLLEDGSNILL